MDFLAKLRQALGLSADATEDAMLTSVSAHALAGATLGKVSAALGLATDAKSDDVVAGVTAKVADAGKLTAIAAHCKAAGLELEKLTPSELQTQLMARAAGSETELRQTVISLQSQLNTISADQAKEKATAFVDAAIAAGKPIKPLRDHFIARHQKDAAAVETEINALVSIHSGGVVKPPKSSESGALDADEQQVVALMGLDPKKYAESKAALEKTAL